MPALRFSNVTKRFPGVVALRDVSFDVQRGSCHAVCGENGAGKSTLGKILAGLQKPDGGQILLDDVPLTFDSPRDALQSGVAMVHQELAFCENMTVGENLCLGQLPRRFGFVQQDVVRARAAELLAAIGATIDPDRGMASLTVAEQQLVQIAGAVGAAARVIVFDEPTSSLARDDVERLFALIARLQARGVTILYVSHRMAEIHRLCDEITVLRDGRHVATRPATELGEAELVQLMIGRRLEQYFPAHPATARGEERLRVAGLTRAGAFSDVSFALHGGEVLGLAGLVGAGRTEIAQTIFGLESATSGSIVVRGQRVSIRSVPDALRLRIGFVPEDRKKQGLVLGMKTGENCTLPTLPQFSRLGWIDRARERGTIRRLFGRLRVRAPEDAITASLSGGNQQKIVMAKWLASDCDILLLDEPTRGVDVGAKAELHAWIDEQVSNGCAVLLISSELPELIALSSRILVLRSGRVVGEVTRAEATQDGLLRLMTGLEPAAVRQTA
ncbi:MAG TPA: sugar ABC transporter ATP-binding protein [Gemmatimonadaceae bacterium]|nr:sugar ABC transporter ATP-binding protein [Gemmatimonadaceae bacterium]